MNKELIISAYDRDYSWVNQLDPTVKVTVYRKGDISKLNHNELYIENNVGRDVHTFFYHLVNRYNTLSDFTFFSQDFPFDHVSNYINIINGDVNVWNSLAREKKDGCWFFCTQYDVLKCDQNGNPHHPGLNIKEIWDELFILPIPNLIQFTPAGHFCIHKNNVRNIPLSYLKKILNILEIEGNNPWIIERLESNIFLTNNYKL